MGSGIFSFHQIGGGEPARERVQGGWSIDWTLHEDMEPDAEHAAIDSFDVRKYTKWQYMTIREKKSIDPSVFRDWFHPTRPPVITLGIGPQHVCHSHPCTLNVCVDVILYMFYRRKDHGNNNN